MGMGGWDSGRNSKKPGEKSELKAWVKGIRILAIVPAFNEENSISGVIQSLNELDYGVDVLVVNDGSKDATGIKAKKTGQALVVNLSANLGIGGAVQTGFKYAHRNHYDIAFQFDGDGQHMASEIEKIIRPVIENQADMVIGSRFLKKHNDFRSTFVRRIGIRVFQYLNMALIGQRITDNTSGFRAYGSNAIAFLAQHYPTDFPEPEAVILLGRNGFNIKEIFVSMQVRDHGRSSINGLGSIYYMVKVVLSVLMCWSRKRLR